MADDGEHQREERPVEQLECLTSVITALAQEVERLRRCPELAEGQWHPLSGSLRRLLWRSFLQGIASGLGRAMGATVILALLVWLLGRLQVVPVLGTWIARLLETIQTAP